MVRRTPTLLLATAVAMGGLLSCLASTEKVRTELVSGTPVQQASAAVTVAQRCDVESVPELIALLGDTDPAVRMYAIMALRDLTGQTCGYKFYGSQAERAAAIRRWQDALRAGIL
jgi:hypothetical protein